VVRHARVTAELGPWEVNGNPTTVINSNSQKAQQLDSKRHSFVAVESSDAEANPDRAAPLTWTWALIPRSFGIG
jgi:hypothetical protein